MVGRDPVRGVAKDSTVNALVVPARLSTRYPIIILLVLAAAVPAFAAMADQIIGTKTGKVYHTHPTECSSARRIGADNRITFASVQEAEQSGRRLCKVCADIDKNQSGDKPDAKDKGKSNKPARKEDGKSGGKPTDAKSEGSDQPADPQPTDDPALPEFARVTGILPGGTIELDNGEKASLLGIICPDPGLPMADDAVRFIKEQTQGRQVKLSRDPAPGAVGYYDDLGRLRVYLTPDPDGRDLGGELLFQGYAWLDRDARFDRRAEYARREEEAWQAKRGIWKPLDGEAGKRQVVTGRHAQSYHEPDCPRVADLTGKLVLTLNEAKARRLPPARCCGHRPKTDSKASKRE